MKKNVAVGLISSAVFFLLVSCGTKTENKTESTQDQSKSEKDKSNNSIVLDTTGINRSSPNDEIEQPLNKDEAKKARVEFESLYNELIKLKETENFMKYGFATGGPYNDWLKKAENLDKKYNPKILLDRGIVLDDLQTLGIYYASSKGSETNETTELNKTILDGLAFRPSTNENQSINPGTGIQNYRDIVSKYNLLGKWKFFNSILESKGVESAYKYEIYKVNEKTCVGVYAQEDYNFKTEILEKKGSDYFIKGNNANSEHGEYYKIDSRLNLVLFDESGDLTEAGWKATKEK